MTTWKDLSKSWKNPQDCPSDGDELAPVQGDHSNLPVSLILGVAVYERPDGQRIIAFGDLTICGQPIWSIPAWRTIVPSNKELSGLPYES